MIGWFVGGVLVLAAAAIGFRVGRRGAVERYETSMKGAREELVQRINELFAFQELSFMLAGSLNVEPVVDQVTAYVSKFVKSDGALLALETGGDPPLRVAAASGVLADLVGTEFSEAEAGMIGDAMQHGHVEVAHADDENTPLLMAGQEFAIITVAPLGIHDEVVGALAIVKNTPHPFSAEDLRLAATVATHAAVALQNARFFELIKTGKDQWEATFDALANGVAVVDKDNCIRRANRALADLLGTTLPDVIGRNLSEALMGDGDALTEVLDAARARRPRAPVTHRSSLIQRTLRMSAAPMPGAGHGWVVTLVEDVTAREAMEAQLIQHEKLAAVGQLVSGVAHELNNPITSIAGLSDFLLERGEDRQLGEQLRLIHEQADRAGRIVKNLLAFARKGPTDIAPADVNEIVRRTVLLTKHEFKLRETRLEVDLAEDLPEVMGDRYQLQQVVLNLLTNALDAAEVTPDDRERRVQIATLKGRRRVIIRVSDSGPGIPERVVPEIFTPFFTTKSPDRGTGLGLSITYRIVQGHGGHIRHRAAEHGGAIFEVALPPRPATENEPDATSSTTPAADPTPHHSSWPSPQSL